MDNYKINPVRGTCMRHNCNYTDNIASLNDTCFSICGAFTNTTDPYNMDPACTRECEKFIEQKRLDDFGVGSCDHQTPYRPVLWGEYSRYVPLLMKKGRTPEQALEEGRKLCDSVSNLEEQCKVDCLTDYNSIERYSKPIVSQSFITDTEKKDPAFFWIIMIILSLLIFYVVYLIIRRTIQK
jgi:hypothetical protein